MNWNAYSTYNVVKVLESQKLFRNSKENFLCQGVFTDRTDENIFSKFPSYDKSLRDEQRSGHP